MVLQQIRFLAQTTALAAIASSLLLPPASAQITEQEFQMGRAREACRVQAERQLLGVNSVVSTLPIPGSGGMMIGSEVILNVSRSGATYDVRCIYDNASRVATISSTSDPGTGTPGDPPSSLPTSGTYSGRGLASGSVFGSEREAEADLSFNNNNFSLGLAVPPGTGAQVRYLGRITRLRATSANNPSSFILEGRLESFASSQNNLLVLQTAGTCQIEIFDARIVSTSCAGDIEGSATQFQGLQQF